jgi:prepilin-type N-terminal cleavage/methylation domain-containing protein
MIATGNPSAWSAGLPVLFVVGTAMRPALLDNRRNRLPRGFTLVELLVVIAIIGLLVALLLPAIQAARESSRRVHCLNNLKQIGLAILHYEEGNYHLPAGSTTEGTAIGGPYYTTWTVDILPHLEQQVLFDLWDASKPLYHPNNQQVRESFVASYLCPSDIDLEVLGSPETGPGSNAEVMAWAPGSYRAMSGHSSGESGNLYWDDPSFALSYQEPKIPDWTRGPLHTVARNPGKNRKFQPVNLAEITDGASNTLMVGEYHTLSFPPRRTYWAYPYTSYNQSSALLQRRTLLPDYLECVSISGVGTHTCKRGWGSLHALNMIQFVYCDGSAHSISQDIDLEVFVSGGTIQGGEYQSLPH